MPAPEQKKWEGHAGPLMDSVSGYDVIDCSTCGFTHIIPIPTAEDLVEVYRKQYYTAEKPRYLELHREDIDWWNLSYGERYDTFEEHLPVSRRRILDVGSGPGFFLLHGKNRGWLTQGVEPSSHAAAHARSLGLEILEEFLTDDVARRLGKYDAVHLSEVLEHIPDPAAMLKRVGSLLERGGLVCIVAPNDYSPFQDALRNVCGFKPWWVAPPHHINYFNFNSLGRLLESCGFEVVLKEATFPIDLFLLMGDNYVGNDALGRQCHGRRKTLELNLAKAGMTDLKRKLYQAWATIGVGREVQIFGRKK